MDTAKQHWQILGRVPNELVSKVRSFMVIGGRGDGVLLLTQSGDGYWLGQIGFGMDTKQTMEPSRLDVSNLASMAHGDEHIVLLDENGQIYAMGLNDSGQLGLGTVDDDSHYLPHQVSNTHKFISVRCGDQHSLALTEDGKVWAWGANDYGQVGFPKSATLPSLCQISELDSHRVVSIECGASHSLALTDQDEVYVWGKNDWRQLGHENLENLHTPTKMSTVSLVKSVAAGFGHTLLLTQTGEVYACGSNHYGQLGLPITTKYSTSLVKVAGLPAISVIASHFNSRLSIAMSSDRECFVWGYLDSSTRACTPFRLPPIYSTIDSVLSFSSSRRNTPYSIRVEDSECLHRTDSATQTEWPSDPNKLGIRVSQMFDNPDSSPDVKFEFGDQTILSHRSVLQITSEHFRSLFSESFSLVHLNPSNQIQKLSPNPFGHTTNPSESDHQTSPISSHFQTILISDYSYSTFHAYICYLYRGTLEIPDEDLIELFELSHSYHESELEQLCLMRMRSTISLENCCLCYQLTERHPLPEFQQELLHFISTNISKVFPTEAYQLLEPVLCKKLTTSIGKLQL